MKRDLDLIRRLCLELEALPAGAEPIKALADVQKAEFSEHARMLIEAGLAEGTLSNPMNGTGTVFLRRLTWSGHDFVSAARDDTIWRKAQESILKPTASFTFDVLRDWLKAEITQGFPTVRALS